MKLEEFIQVVLSVLVMLGSAGVAISAFVNPCHVMGKIGAFIIFALSLGLCLMIIKEGKK